MAAALDAAGIPYVRPETDPADPTALGMPDVPRPLPAWMTGLERRDWLLNGYKPPTKEQWAALDWSRAWVDLGPSIAGNPGPYWHVPWLCEGEELLARLYPKLLLSKWGPLVLHACIEAREIGRSPPGSRRRS